ncbi:hypothetical protein LCGC14_3115660, partial [marine sediment metagenome]
MSTNKLPTAAIPLTGNTLGGLLGSNWQTITQIHGGAPGQPGSGLTTREAHAALQTLSDAYETILQSLYPDPHGPGEEPIKDTGIEVGEVIAWRCWRVEDGCLHSWTAKQEWRPGETIKAHTIGQIIGEGIHAFKRKIDAMKWASNELKYHIVGQVALWGTIYEFEKGWHGEYAKIHSLDWVAPGFMDFYGPIGFWRRWRLLKRLRETYGLSGVLSTEKRPGSLLTNRGASRRVQVRDAMNNIHKPADQRKPPGDISGLGLSGLVKRLEAAPKGSRELDVRIQSALDGHEEAEPYSSDATLLIYGSELSHYTTSLDAALTLV